MSAVLKAHIDFESGSPQPLGAQNSVGVHRYAEDPATRIWGFRWRIGNEGPVYEWRPGYPDPQELIDHIALGGKVVAHNAAFERIMWNWVLRMRYAAHWPPLMVCQQECTMARAAAMGLPGSLDKLGSAIGTNNQKGDNSAMLKMSKPRTRRPDGTYIWYSDDTTLIPGTNMTVGEKLYNDNMVYCGQDVLTETDIDNSLPSLSPSEQECWEFDQTINDRGVMIDVAMVERAVQLVDIAKKRADQEMRRLTKGQVRKATEVAKIVEWLNGRGIICTSMRKGDFDDIIFQTELISDAEAEAVIRLRKAASKTSTAKFAKMLKVVCSDGRLYGQLRWHGARTGRWAGALVQLQNFPRFDHENELEVAVVEWLIELLSSDMAIAEVHECIYAVHGEVMGWLSKSLRSAIIAPPGKKLVGGDFSNIEGRVNAWLGGEAWKLQAFLDYDTFVPNPEKPGKMMRKGDDLYKLAYARSFGANVKDVTKAQRQIGKVQELALGYQGGVGAFITMGANYNVNPYDIAKVVERVAPAKQWDETAVKYKAATDKCGLQEREWTALKIVVINWRAAHPGIVQSWWDYSDAAIAAVDRPGEIVWVSNTLPVRYMCDGNFLYCCLPSGRVISYAQPWVQESTVVRVNKNGEEYETTQRQVRFWGIDSTTKQWCVQYLYGGMQCENVVQAVARDLMVPAMFRVERAGYPVILTVHDEILSEVDEAFGSADHYAELMSVLPEWATGLHLAASAWEDKRYVK